MLGDALELIYESFKSVIDAFDVPILNYGISEFTFWEIVLGIFTVSLVFGFFLRTRGGSVFGAVENYNKYQNHKRAESERRERESYNESYEAYQNKRSRNEWYGRKYNAERGRSNE